MKTRYVCKTLTEKYDGEITKADVELDEMLLSRVETNFSQNTLAVDTVNVTANNMTFNASVVTSVKDYKFEVSFVEKVTKDSLLQCYCSKVLYNPLVYGTVYDSLHYFNPKKDIMNITDGGFNYTIPHASDYPKGDWCVKYVYEYGQITGLTFGSVMLVIVINMVLKAFMKRLVKFERPLSKSGYSVSLSTKLFIVQLINTAVILLIVNGNLNAMGVTDQTITVGGLIFVGDHDDFNSNWYVVVGSSLVLTMIVNLLTPTYSPLGNCVTRGMKRVSDRSKFCICCKQDRQFTKRLNESEYEALWDGGEFELPARYGAIQMVYWVTMMYGTGLPVLYVLAFVYFTLTYWIDVSI